MTGFPFNVQRLAIVLWLALGAVSLAAEDYPLTADSLPQPGVPQGEVKGPFRFQSEIFPGTVRDYWLYVPAQYSPDRPACLMVVQDGLNRANDWKLTTVMDNLIHKKEMPVTIGLFINPGVVPAVRENALPRYNRSFEYDSLGDRYARFLLEEILPEVGKQYNLSSDPNDRSIAGASSGAICAFNVAWERPDAFRRVLSTIGTYVGLRGGNEFPTLIRKTEPKPIRVFLQDGKNDLNIYGGDWWTANLEMLSALTWSQYDVHHAWGDGGHDGKHSAAILPDALRWLWRDYPAPVSIGPGLTQRTEILLPDEGWIKVAEGYQFTEGPAVNQAGELFFTDIPSSRILKIGLDDSVSVFAENTGKANGLMFGGDGRLYACANEKKEIVAYTPDGRSEAVAQGVSSNDLVVNAAGLWFTDPANKQVYFLPADQFGKPGGARVVDQGIERPNGIVLSPDQSLLYVADSAGQFVYSFQIAADGTLAHKQPYFHLHLPYGQPTSGADGMTVDAEGRLYVATRIGLQVTDQPGRVHLILPKPQPGPLSNVVFGGPNLDTLYVTCGDKVFKRRVKAHGVRFHEPPVQPATPRL